MTLLDKSARYLDQLSKMCITMYNSHTLRKYANSLVVGASQLKGSLEQSKTRPSFYISLEPNWKVELNDQNICGTRGKTELHFGGEIVFKDKCLERQVLTVVILFHSEQELPSINGRPKLCAGENYVVRRFHFDFDRSVANGDKPLAHLQVGGQLNSCHLLPTNSGPIRYELFDQLDLPRIPWTIVDLPIVLHTFLNKFPTDLNGFLEEKQWRRHVMDSERLWLSGYFHEAATMMKSMDRECLYDYSCSEAAYDS